MGTPVFFHLEREQLISRPRQIVFEFFNRPENLSSITPAFLHFRILTPGPIVMKTGTRIQYQIKVRGLPIHWDTEITHYNPPFGFVDEQIKGPYARWRHEHSFVEQNSQTLMRDRIEYALPFGILGRWIHRWVVRRDLEKIFSYRAQKIEQQFV